MRAEKFLAPDAASALRQFRAKVGGADLQAATDILLIAAEGNLAAARSQVNETMLPMRTSVDSMLLAYARIKIFHALGGSSDCVVYMFSDRRQGGDGDGRAVANLGVTAERFLRISVCHIGCVVTGNDTEYLGITSHLAYEKTGGSVAIEARVAHLFTPERDRSIPGGALLLQ